MSDLKVKVFQKSATGLQPISFVTNSALVDIVDFTPYTAAELEGAIPSISNASNINQALKILDANIRKNKVATDSNYEGLAEVARTGNWIDIIDAPAIPSKTSDLTNDSNFVTSDQLNSGLEGKLDATASAASAVKLDSDVTAGHGNNPVYFKDGLPVAIPHTISTSVPADAKFTDTTYSTMGPATLSTDGAEGLVPAPVAGKQGSFLRGDGTWQDIVIPTKVSDLNNDSNYVTNSVMATALSSKLGTDEIAASASKLDVNGGSEIQPVYFKEGVPTKTTHTLEASVPADAKFTDTIYTHPNSGVTAGSVFRSVTVNAQGHVTAGTNPTTLAGYGITDAKIDNGTITLGDNTLTPLTSVPDMTAATASAAGAAGLVPAPAAGSQDKFLRGDGTWTDVTVPTKTSQLTNDSNYVTTTDLNSAIGDKLGVDDTAVAAEKITTDAGSETQPVYFKDGVPVNTTYTLGVSVPADAKFTDTVYTLEQASNTKLGGVYVDLVLSETSVNPVQNKAIYSALNDKAPIESPTFTGTVKAPTVASSTNDDNVATTAYVQALVNEKFGSSDALVFKGTIGTGGTVTALPATHEVGWTYKVITAGTYAGVKCEVGDMIICLTDGTSANNAHWTVVQTNIDGAVVGPTSSVANQVAVFDGTTGKVIKDSGLTLGVSVPADAIFTDTIYTHPNSGITAGTYRSLTVNAQGHVTAGTNPTTLAGYGITDAKIDNGTITLGDNTLTPLTSDSSITAAKVTGLATVATSGSYNDLSNLPDIPDAYTHPNSGITAGTYRSLTVNAQGHVTAGTNPTTLAGYGITDAKIDNGVITLGSNNITPLTSIPDATSNSKGGVIVGNNITVTSGTISLTKDNITNALGFTPPTTNTTYSDMVAATESAAGAAGLVPAPPAGANTKYLCGDGTWKDVEEPAMTDDEIDAILNLSGEQYPIDDTTYTIMTDEEIDAIFE